MGRQISLNPLPAFLIVGGGGEERPMRMIIRGFKRWTRGELFVNSDQPELITGTGGGSGTDYGLTRPLTDCEWEEGREREALKECG